MQLGGGVPNQVRGCHPCAHGLVPKSPQLSRQVMQVLLGVGSGYLLSTLKFKVTVKVKVKAKVKVKRQMASPF